ncbi:MAG: bifunctional precorrin-2 dehydrogenase/sirohydrochlorin ferrochelatase [Planctomycetota bacterium]
MPGYFPVSLKLEGRRCLVVGGGRVALRKARALLDAGAEVVAVAPRFDAAFRKLKGKVRLLRKRYTGADIRGCAFVVAATSDARVNARVSRDARRRRIPVNVVDVPDLSDVIIPSTLRRGGFTISVSTGGSSPLLAQKVRRELEKYFPKAYSGYVSLLGELRKGVFARPISAAEKRRALRGLLDGRGLAIYLKKGRAAARAYILRKLGDED